MANVSPEDYPRPDIAIHLTTSWGATFSILFRNNRYPMVLGPVYVYRTERIFTRNPESLERNIDPDHTNLYRDLRTHVGNANQISLTQNRLTIIWPRSVTICNEPNVRSVIFEFEYNQVSYGSRMLYRTRSGPKPPPHTQS
jgi:hypothetical protein